MISNIELPYAEEPKAYEIKHWGIGVHTEESIKSVLMSYEVPRIYVMYRNRNILIGYGSKATGNLKGGYIYDVVDVKRTLNSLIKSLEIGNSIEKIIKNSRSISYLDMFHGWWGDIYDRDIYEIIKSTKKVLITDSKLPDLII